MNTVYLNGAWTPMTEARISPMDRGFLFGDGIYEVVPSYGGRPVGLGPHLRRLATGLDALEIDPGLTEGDWRQLVSQLIERNGAGNLGIYLHVSRGAYDKRNHAYPAEVQATVFAYAFEIPAAPSGDPAQVRAYRVSTAEDLRWKRCHIKATALLGNVMHMRQGQAAGNDETILFNTAGELTEAAACNVFLVSGGAVATPPLDHQKLPGITRELVLDILRRYSDVTVEERVVHREELAEADEVWLTSSSKEIAPVTAIDGHPVGDGRVGPVWASAQALFAAHKFEY
ncbi:aminotransferase class IV [Pseudohaliea rubra]|uniref:Aminodeoxychorismate lyase n=1 Tax=Pseudohaliea rubra DSM 19751 TaxID=1265313 RepID=A0A095VV26_9GAMM|nr:aminotransferase class IV [Pseudohaliea rubra]KGE04908.1 D-alanine aminotransferase [Pseudohaliea rubra DSM 19751]